MDIYSKTDEAGQKKAIEYLYKAFAKSGAELDIEQHFEDKGRIDMFVTATTKNSTCKYAIETKDRYMSIDRYEDYFIPMDKYYALIGEIKNGYKPIYINTFEDGCLIWNVAKCKIYDAGERWLSPTTVVKKQKEKQHKYSVKVDDAVWQSRETI